VTADPPRIFTPNCEATSESTVTAKVSDNVGVTSARMTWTGPGEEGGGSRAMSGSGGTWTATLGPFSSQGTVSYSVIATDAAGNPSTARSGTVSVSGCGTSVPG
jgi:hypothetical protein